ncbi:hypothetical protein, partial [Paracoccus sp. (in: a-proteobacteria)]|uniref:hypothetical protein n=1 Tax=Paracoccus sp. TaxID=267 RepID=UPI00391706F2
MQPESRLDHALSFSADAVHLLRRRPTLQPDADWEVLGSAEFASASFRQDLAELRHAVQPQDELPPLPVVLVIPDDQILYTELHIPAEGGRDQAVGQALDGLTPYSIDQLAYDWRGEGDEVRVAAVARQTLLEAQEFANRHGFEGVEYSARPTSDEYPGIPVFRLAPEDPAEAGAADTGLAGAAEDEGVDVGLVPLDELASDESLGDVDFDFSDEELNLDLDADIVDEAPAAAPDLHQDHLGAEGQGSDQHQPDHQDAAQTAQADDVASDEADVASAPEALPLDQDDPLGIAAAEAAEGASTPDDDNLAVTQDHDQVTPEPLTHSDEAEQALASADAVAVSHVSSDADLAADDSTDSFAEIANEQVDARPDAGLTQSAEEIEPAEDGDAAAQGGQDLVEAVAHDLAATPTIAPNADATEGAQGDHVAGSSDHADLGVEESAADEFPALDQSASDEVIAEALVQPENEATEQAETAEHLADHLIGEEDGASDLVPSDGLDTSDLMAEAVPQDLSQDLADVAGAPVAEASDDEAELTVSDMSQGDVPAQSLTDPALDEVEQIEDDLSASELAGDMSADDLADDDLADDDLTEAERAALAAAAAEVAAAEDAARASPQVVRHGAPPLMGLNARAQAVRDRAAEARRNPGEVSRPVAAPRKFSRSKSNRSELMLMIGALVVGLLLVWAFLSPRDNPALTALRDAERGALPVESNGSQSPAVATQTGADNGTASNDLTTTGTGLNGDLPSGVTQADGADLAAGAPDQGNATTSNPADGALASDASALSPAERASVITAATGPLAAVLAQSVDAARPATAAPQTAATPTGPADGAADGSSAGQAPAQAVATAPATEQPAGSGAEAVVNAAPTPAEQATSAGNAAGATEKAAAQAVSQTASQAAATVVKPVTAKPVDSRPAPSQQPAGDKPAVAAGASKPAAATASAAKPVAQPQPVRRNALSSSARPQSATAPRRRAVEPSLEKAPSVPSNPLPYEAAQRQPVRPAAVRPPNRPAPKATPAAATPAPSRAAPAEQSQSAAPAATTRAASGAGLRGSNRPPARPEGSAPDMRDDGGQLDPAEQRHLDGLIRDLRAQLPGADVTARHLVPQERNAQFAEARPARPPAALAERSRASGGGNVDATAVDAALRAANSPPAQSNAGSAVPARDSGGLLRNSNRPQARPLLAGRAKAAPAAEAVEEAVASAVGASSRGAAA